MAALLVCGLTILLPTVVHGSGKCGCAGLPMLGNMSIVGEFRANAQCMVCILYINLVCTVSLFSGKRNEQKDEEPAIGSASHRELG